MSTRLKYKVHGYRVRYGAIHYRLVNATVTDITSDNVAALYSGHEMLWEHRNKAVAATRALA